MRGCKDDMEPDNPIYRPWVVLVLLFCALGPLALPVLWGSPRFSRRAKVLLTAAVTVLTVVVLWLLWVVAVMLVRQVREARDLGGF